MKISNYQDVKALKAEEGAAKLNVRWLISKEMGAENFAMRLFEVEPDGYSPLHSHPWEHEIFVLEGKGVATDGKNGKEFKEDDFIFIPSGEMHQLRNMSQGVLRFICLIPYKQNEKTVQNDKCAC